MLRGHQSLLLDEDKRKGACSCEQRVEETNLKPTLHSQSLTVLFLGIPSYPTSS
jgi:hypothetical protein